MKHAVKSFALLVLLVTSGWAAQAQAENLQLSCLVDTPAFDQYSEGACGSYWPGGPTTTTAVFEVFGQDAGVSYTYQWSAPDCTNNYKQCITSIRANRMKTVSVTVTNNSTGVSRVLTAIAEYLRD